MKWYTLEERPIKKGDEGLFLFPFNTYVYGEFIGDNEAKIILWIPKHELDKAVNSYDFIMKRVYLSKEELKATLPEDKK